MLTTTDLKISLTVVHTTPTLPYIDSTPTKKHLNATKPFPHSGKKRIFLKQKVIMFNAKLIEQ